VRERDVAALAASASSSSRASTWISLDAAGRIRRLDVLMRPVNAVNAPISLRSRRAWWRSWRSRRAERPSPALALQVRCACAARAPDFVASGR
jgi:hypothetical protein